ncbi:hypothetical protein [Candidatus Poriferisocius sp.]|uniref:hypothetical protein n=1 Tax=Candidatus Poriferisocius sp. TaxID=3101276 RepID=UPI003B5AE301
MGTTTIRVDAGTYIQLLEMSRDAGMTLAATVRDAAEVLWRQRFANHALRQLSELQKDREAWQEYLAEAEETQVADSWSGDEGYLGVEPA